MHFKADVTPPNPTSAPPPINNSGTPSCHVRFGDCNILYNY